MAVLYNKLARKIVLTILLLWAIAGFWIISQEPFFKVVMSFLSALCLIFIWSEVSAIFLLIFFSFSISFILYGLLSQFTMPPWLIMISILILFGYLFLYTEQKIGILGNKRLIYLVLFSLITLEIFVLLNFFFVSPLTKSLTIATISYLFVGFCYTILAKNTDTKFSNYALIAFFVILAIFASSVWGAAI